jgi:hypothetical protein
VGFEGASARFEDVVAIAREDIVVAVRGYRAVSARRTTVGGRRADHTVGVVLEFSGAMTRVDQVVVDGWRGPIVFQLFTPGVDGSEGVAPVVDRTLASVELD